LFIGNDTGSMHVAAAAGTPALALFGSSCPHRYSPWGQGHRALWSELPCSPCHTPDHLFRCQRCIFDAPKCMLAITVDHAAEAAALMLAPTARANPAAAIAGPGTAVPTGGGNFAAGHGHFSPRREPAGLTIK
jgi:hypothetical protein